MKTSPNALCLGFADWIGALFFSTCALFFITHLSEFSVLLLPTLAHEFIVAASFLMRRKPRGRDSAWRSRGIAYAGTYYFPISIIALRVCNPHGLVASHASLNLLGGFLWLIGSLFSVCAVWCLRRSFSIEPQARELVANGPYTVARHPIYLSYILQYGGVLLLNFTPALALSYAIWLALIIMRARLEEQVLQASFPEYATYRDRVGMFWPIIHLRKTSEPPREGGMSVATLQ